MILGTLVKSQVSVLPNCNDKHMCCVKSVINLWHCLSLFSITQ